MASAGAAPAAGAPACSWDPWDKVAEGKTGTMSRADLKKEFQVTDCGGLKCRACSKFIAKAELEEKAAAGVFGILSNHLRSNDHQAAVAGAKNKKTGGGLVRYLKSRQPTTPGPGPREGDEGGAAPPAAARGAAEAGAAPAGPRARPGTLVIESVDEEEDEAAAEGVIDAFKSLPARSQSSVAQQITMLSMRCKGFRPPSLEGKADLLNHVPGAFFYASGSYGSTNIEHIGTRFQLRQHNFHAVGCLEFADPGASTCRKCSAIEPSQLERHMPYLNKPAAAIPAKTNDAHYSPVQMKEKKDALREAERQKNLQLLTTKRKVHRRERALGHHERLMVALTRGSARMMQAALVQARRAGHGVVGVLKLVTKCLEGVYTPRTRFTELDMGIATLLCTFGGGAGAYAANKGLGLPCQRLVQKTKEVAAFLPTVYQGLDRYAHDIKKAVVANLRASFVQPILEQKQPWRRCFGGQWMMALDGVANDKKVRFHSQTGTIIGGCEHKPGDISLELNTPRDGEAVLEALRRGQNEPASSRAMHLAGETVVICFKPITATGEDSPLLPAAAVPTCNKRSCIKIQKELLTAAVGGFNSLRGLGLEGLGDVVMIATDGDAKRRRALTALCNMVDGQVPAAELLTALDMFDTYGGELQVTVDFDMRHMVKRVRVRLVFTDKGMQLSPYGVKWTRDKAQDLFKKYGVSILSSVFDNTDKQNVPAAVNLLEGFGQVAGAMRDELPTQKGADVMLLGALGEHLLKPSIGGVNDEGTEVSLKDALVSYAAAAFLLLVIFSEMGSAFIPPQLYHDLQSTIKNLYVLVARQLQDPKNEGAASLLFFLLGTDELEKLFGTLRRLSPGLTFDLLQLIERIGAAALVQSIYAKYPELDPGSRRLKASKDKVNAGSWHGELRVVGEGILVSCWQEGRRLALDLLERHYYYGAKMTMGGVDTTRAEIIIREAKEKGGSMMRPKGQLVGVSVAVGGDLEEKEEEEEEGVEGLAPGAEEGETAEAEADWGAAVRGPLWEMEEEAREAMEQEELRAFESLAQGGAVGEEARAAVEVAHRKQKQKLYFDLAGGAIPKARWLREQVEAGGVATSRGSADRVARYRGEEKGGGAGGGARRQLAAAEMDERVVQVGDPVVYAVLVDRSCATDVDLRVVTTKGTLGVGVGEIVGLQNKGEGKRRLPFLREGLFMAADTTVEVRPIKVAAVGTTEKEGVAEAVHVLELRLEEYTTPQPFSFKGGRHVGLFKADVVHKEDDTGGTEHVFQIDAHLLGERLALFAEEVRLLAGGGRAGLAELPIHSGACVELAGTVELALWKEKDTSVVRCEPCLRSRQSSDMLRAHLRQHAAGHLFLSPLPMSRCGFCGLEVAETGCGLALGADGKLRSTCSLTLAKFRYGQFAQEWQEALQQRLELDTEKEVANATKSRLRLPKPTVRNIPIPCPIPGCSSTIWSYNFIPHFLEPGHPLPLPGRAQRFRKRGWVVLRELHKLIATSPRAPRTYALGEGVLVQVEEKLEEMRDLLAAGGQDLSRSVSFCLEELVRESQAALSKYYSTLGPYEARAGGKRKGKCKGGGDDSSAAEAAAATAEEESEDEAGDDIGGDDGGEEEGEGKGEGKGEGADAATQLSGKRPADGHGAGSGGKGSKRTRR